LIDDTAPMTLVEALEVFQERLLMGQSVAFQVGSMPSGTLAVVRLAVTDCLQCGIFSINSTNGGAFENFRAFLRFRDMARDAAIKLGSTTVQVTGFEFTNARIRDIFQRKGYDEPVTIPCPVEFGDGYMSGLGKTFVIGLGGSA
jgi:hypothetical protein